LDRGTYFRDTLTPPLARVAIALGPYLAGSRSQGRSNVWDEGNAILEYQGHYQRTLTLARLGILPFFWLACFVLWRLVSRTYRYWHAALSVVLFSFCPLVLAHASLATIDMALTAMFLLALVCFWNFLQEPKLSTAVLAGVTIALAILCKLSAVPYLGISCTALYVYVLIEKRHIPSWKYIGIGAAAVALTIWAGYRFSVGPILHQGQLTPNEMTHLRRLPGTVARWLFFPELPPKRSLDVWPAASGSPRAEKTGTCLERHITVAGGTSSRLQSRQKPRFPSCCWRPSGHSVRWLAQ